MGLEGSRTKSDAVANLSSSFPEAVSASEFLLSVSAVSQPSCHSPPLPLFPLPSSPSMLLSQLSLLPYLVKQFFIVALLLLLVELGLGW